MLLIHCPHCGDRDQTEFSYGGDATIDRPSDPGAATPDAWHTYIYERSNPRGLHREYWQHIMGCRRWLVVTRDTMTHEISETSALVHQPREPEA